MEDIINIIKEIKELEEKAQEEANNNAEQMEQVINDKRVEYLKAEIKELKQEDNETKDFFKKSDLKLAINSKEAELQKEMGEIRKKVISARKKEIKGLYKKLDEKKLHINNDIEAKRHQIQDNIKEMHRIKDNRDVMKDEKGIIKPEYQKAYADLTKEIMKKREENIQTNKSIKEMEELVLIIENKEFDKLLKEPREEKAPAEGNNDKTETTVADEKKSDVPVNNNNSPKWHDKLTQDQIEELQAEGIEPGDPEYDLALANYGIRDAEEQNKTADQQKADTENTANTTNTAHPQTIGKANASQILKITIGHDKAHIVASDREYELNVENMHTQRRYDKLSQDTLAKVKSVKNADRNIIGALLDNEPQLNEYLDLCMIYEETDERKQKYSLNTKNLPEIEYNFKDLKRNDWIENKRKIEMYKKAKETKKMFKNIVNSKVKVKMNIFDRLHFETQLLKEELASTKALPASEKSEVVKDVETQYDLEANDFVSSFDSIKKMKQETTEKNAKENNFKENIKVCTPKEQEEEGFSEKEYQEIMDIFRAGRKDSNTAPATKPIDTKDERQ